jgi:hypothetical protein
MIPPHADRRRCSFAAREARCGFLLALVGAAPSVAAPKKYASKTWPTLYAVTDMNGNGSLDLAVPNIGPSSVSVLESRGTGASGGGSTIRPAISQDRWRLATSTATGSIS